MGLFLHLRDKVMRVTHRDAIPVPLDPDLLWLAEQAKNQSVIQDIYRQQMERNRFRPFYGDHAGHAKEGGQTGANGEWYKGGEFLPSSKHTEKGKYRTGAPSLKHVSSGEVAIEPGKKEKPPSPLHRSIFDLIAPWTIDDHSESREYLDVPYAKRAEAKAKGAKFDWDRKKWYMEHKSDATGKLKLREGVRISSTNHSEDLTRESDFTPGVAGHKSTQKHTMGDLLDRYNRGERWVKVKLPPGVEAPEFRDAFSESDHPRNESGEFTSGGKSDFHKKIDEVVTKHPFGEASAAKRGRNPKFPYVPVVNYGEERGRVRTDQIEGKAFATREEAVSYTKKVIEARRERMRQDLAEPRMRALRRQHGLPQEVPTGDAAEWEEHKHPRDPDGKFTSGGGVTSPSGKTAKETWQEPAKEEPEEETPPVAPTVWNSDFAKWGYEFLRDDHDGPREIRLWKNDKTDTILRAEMEKAWPDEQIGDWKLIGSNGDVVAYGYGKRYLTEQLDQHHTREIKGPKPPDRLANMAMQTNAMKYADYDEGTKRWVFRNEYRDETLEVSSESLRGMGLGGRFWEHKKPGVRYNGYGETSLRQHLQRSEKGEIYEGKFSRHWGETLKPFGFEMFIEGDTSAAYKNRDGDQIFFYKDVDKPENAKWRMVNGDTGQSYNDGKGWDELRANIDMLKDQREGEKREADRKWNRTVEEYTSVAADMMKSLGYPPAKLTITRKPDTFTLNGRRYNTAGYAHFANGEVELFPANLSLDGVRGVTAHEVMHQKFQTALNEYEVERNEINSHPDGDVSPEDYPVFTAIAPIIQGKFKELQESDGVTGYSREWWDAYNNKTATQEQAMHETLAEMAFLEVTDPTKLKTVAKPWRDLYRHVTSLYKDQERRKWRKAERKQERERKPAATPAPHEHLANVLAQALTAALGQVGDRAPFKEEEHPRGGDPEHPGRFSEAGGPGAKTETSTESVKIESQPKPDSPSLKPLKGSAKGSHPATISTRRPTYKGASESDKYRRVDVAAMKEHKPKETEKEKAAVEANFDHDTKLFSETEHYPNFRPGEFDGMTPDERVRHVVDHMKSNLKFLYDHVDKEVHDQGPLWYEGANRMADEAAKKYKLPLQSATGVYAALSPQALWDENVHFAKHVLEIYFDHADHAWDDKMEKTAQRIWKPKDKPLLDSIKGKTLSELTNPAAKAMWIRTYDQTHMERYFEALSPDGHELGYKYKSPKSGNPMPARWKSLSPITNAVLCIESNGDRDIISAAMGDRHKVRSFYNNILDPDSDNGDVTIDTHAAGAALLRPSSQTDVYVMHMFGKGPSTKAESEALHYHGTSSNAYTGMAGLYPIYAQAYRELAEELHIKPRVLQSITWEAKRRLFGEPTKQESRQAKQDVELAWCNYRDGKSTLEQTQNKVLRIGRALAKKEKADAKPSDTGDSGFYEAARYTGDSRELHRYQLGRGGTRSLDTGGRRRDTRRIADGARAVWQSARLTVLLR